MMQRCLSALFSVFMLCVVLAQFTQRAPLVVNGAEITIATLTGQDEIDYWTALVNQQYRNFSAMKAPEVDKARIGLTPFKELSKKRCHIHFDETKEDNHPVPKENILILDGTCKKRKAACKNI
jgi:hypothetical protein